MSVTQTLGGNSLFFLLPLGVGREFTHIHDFTWLTCSFRSILILLRFIISAWRKLDRACFGEGGCWGLECLGGSGGGGWGDRRTRNITKISVCMGLREIDGRGLRTTGSLKESCCAIFARYASFFSRFSAFCAALFPLLGMSVPKNSKIRQIMIIYP